MGSNPSRRKTRGAVLSCPTSHFRGTVLIVICLQCPDHRDIPTHATIARIGAVHSVKAVVQQVRCAGGCTRSFSLAPVLLAPMLMSDGCVGR
jgi:hypothetical protein